MIEINLLPKELRKKQQKQKKQKEDTSGERKISAVALPDIRIPVIPICVGVLALLILAQTGLSFLGAKNTSLIKRLRLEWKGLEPQKKVLDKVRGEMAELRRRLTLIREVSDPDLDWVKLLSGLNQSVIPDVWLKGFKPIVLPGSVKAGAAANNMPDSLKLEGYALGKSEVATSAVARLINSLKANKDFSGYFEEIELQDIRSARVSGGDAMEFRLVCKFKKKQAPPVIKKKR